MLLLLLLAPDSTTVLPQVVQTPVSGAGAGAGVGVGIVGIDASSVVVALFSCCLGCCCTFGSCCFCCFLNNFPINGGGRGMRINHKIISMLLGTLLAPDSTAVLLLLVLTTVSGVGVGASSSVAVVVVWFSCCLGCCTFLSCFGWINNLPKNGGGRGTNHKIAEPATTQLACPNKTQSDRCMGAVSGHPCADKL
jgi:hypothetical protein